jgi:hypothetical protein
VNVPAVVNVAVNVAFVIAHRRVQGTPEEPLATR